MARQKISNRESAGTLTGAELVPIVRTSEALPADRNLQTTAQILSRLAYNRLIEDKDDNFDVDGASGTIYTDTGSGGTINANLQESAVGTTYTFCVTDNAMQVLGGWGYCDEYKVERFLRDAKLLEIGGGTIEAHQKNLTKDLTSQMLGRA